MSSDTAITTMEGIDKVDTDTSSDNKSDEVQQTCAACGKQGTNLNICNKCKAVTYCNAACKKKHRKKHKKVCERRVAELHEEQLFKDIEPDECPLCFLPMPIETDATTFKSCCGKVICNGCIYAVNQEFHSRGKIPLCAYCRSPPESTMNEENKRIKRLLDTDNATACYTYGNYYSRGEYGIPQNWAKANELWLKAGELGHPSGYYNIGHSYRDGAGVEVDTKKAYHYFELAAINGHVNARYILGAMEGQQKGKGHRALNHWVIGARAGHENCLGAVKQMFMRGGIEKDEYENTIRAYHDRRKEMNSDARKKAKEMRYGQNN